MQNNAALLKVRATYDAAADHFDAEPLSFWDRHGRGAVERLALQPGEQVLDVGCGTGASALPAAEAVGAGGFVLGLDVADKMLARARKKAMARGYGNVSFECRDMMTSGLPDAHYDAVISVFSVFFVDDMQPLLSKLWRMLRPGGKLAVTTWGRNAFQPCAEIFTEDILRLRPGHLEPRRPWERLSDCNKTRRLFVAAGVNAPEIDSVEDRQPLRHRDDWWTIALGSGYRFEIDRLVPEQGQQLRERLRQHITRMRVRAIDTHAIHAIAQKQAEQD